MQLSSTFDSYENPNWMDGFSSTHVNATYSYEIDGDDRIVLCSDSWDEFAVENGGDRLVFERIRGESIWDHVSHDATVDLYQRIFASARSGSPVQFFLRCDSPATRRLLTVSVSPTIKGRVRVTTMLFRADSREPINTVLCQAPESTSDDCYTLCTWCNKLDDGDWIELESVIERRTIPSAAPPAVRHGICDPCYDRIDQQLRSETKT